MHGEGCFIHYINFINLPSMQSINRTVWVLSLVSLFADIASEMLYPVIPIYLADIGYSALLIGILEGLANFTAGISKGYFGKRSDEKGLRLPFIQTGYFLSAIAKPMMAFLVYPIWFVFVRMIDRLGKGVRTAARDALLSQNATPQTKATVFGFHRGLDTLGAAIGPALALIFLMIYPVHYREIFLIAFIPGLISVLMIFLLKEKKQSTSTLGRGNFFSFLKYWKIASADYKKLVGGLLFLALFNSADVFLILKANELTGRDDLTIGAYILYNLVFALASYPLGRLADRIGLKKVFFGGLFMFALVYFLFGISNSISIIFVAFFIYGIYSAATDGITKAWITNMAHTTNTATAIGFYTSCESICSLLASVIAGWVWIQFGSSITFFMTAGAAIFVLIYFLFYKKVSVQNHKD